jgi:hypothetical protein
VRLPCVQHAAEAAESAAAQNKFWDLHDHLYEHQQSLDDNHLEKYEQPYWRELLSMNNARRGLPLARAHVEQIFPKLTPAQIRRIAARGCILNY